MSKIQADKKTYTLILLAVMIFAGLTAVFTIILGPDNLLPMIGIGNGTALGTLILSIIALCVVLKSTKKVSLIVMGCWFSYFALAHAYKLLNLLITSLVGYLGGEGAILATAPRLGEGLVLGLSGGALIFSFIFTFTIVWMGVSVLRFFATGKTNNRLFKILTTVTSVFILLFVLALVIFLIIANPVYPAIMLSVIFYNLMDFSLLILFVLFSVDVGRAFSAGK